MKISGRLLTVVLLVLATVLPTYAWELKMDAAYQFRYSYLSRVGPDDLYGNVEQAQGSLGSGQTTIGFSGPWNNQMLVETLSSKGSDASWSQQRLILYPRFIVNPAVSVNAEYAFQGLLNGPYSGGYNWVNPPQFDGWMLNGSRSEDGTDAIGTGFLRTLYLDAELPWGRLKLGRMPFGFGLGWSGLHTDDFRPTLVSLTTPYGPLTFLAAFGLGDTGEYTDPYDTRNANRTPFTIASAVDRNEIKKWDSIFALRYAQGPLDMGFLWKWTIWNKVHSAPFLSWTLRDDMTGSRITAPVSFGYFQSTDPNGGPGSGTIDQPINSDVFLNLFVLYMKYSNGRFFFNGEWDQEYFVVKRQGSRSISGYPYALMVEAGTLYGPSKLTLAGFVKTGHQRSGGELNFNRTAGSNGVTQVSDKWNEYITPGRGLTAIKPYTFLLDYFGSGNNSFGWFNDFIGVGGRFDYAIAANLNMYTTYLYARRQSRTGSWWGQYNGGIAVSPTRASDVPDSNLGWEANVGVDWKLLENMSVDTKFGVWQPGNWFKHAYMDLSTLNTIPDPFSNADVRINPGRGLSPIIGVQSTVTVNF
jgi:hypothetical protein